MSVIDTLSTYSGQPDPGVDYWSDIPATVQFQNGLRDELGRRGITDVHFLMEDSLGFVHLVDSEGRGRQQISQLLAQVSGCPVADGPFLIEKGFDAGYTYLLGFNFEAGDPTTPGARQEFADAIADY